MTTPTPGDLSARLPGYLVKALSAMEKHHARAVIEYIAALSALPAAGGPDGYTLYGQFRHASDADDRWRAEARPVYFTPQPSAAEGDPCIECGAEHGQPCFDGCCCKSDAAVGAQGDGVPPLVAEALEYFGRVDDPAVRIYTSAINRYIRRLAAPAAGKGVDDAMRRRAREWLAANNGYWDGDYVERLLQAILPPDALTRQPVVGALVGSERVHVICVCPDCVTRQPVAGDGEPAGIGNAYGEGGA